VVEGKEKVLNHYSIKAPTRTEFDSNGDGKRENRRGKAVILSDFCVRDE